jgi:hypothetical protein
VVQASLIHSEREIFRLSHDASIFSVSDSSIVTEYRTIAESLSGAYNEHFDSIAGDLVQFIMSLEIFRNDFLKKTG